MLHEALTDYLASADRAIRQRSTTYVERYTEEILTPERVNLRVRLLEINEAVTVENGSLVSLDYRYHCQDEQNRLLCRYDSTPHYPDLTSFPHHKHLPDAVVPSAKPDIEQVIKEAADAVS